MATHTVTQYAAGPDGAIIRIDQTWLEQRATDVHPDAVTAGSVGGLNARDQQHVWALISDTSPDPEQGFAIDDDITESDYLQYLATTPQGDAYDPVVT